MKRTTGRLMRRVESLVRMVQHGYDTSDNVAVATEETMIGFMLGEWIVARFGVPGFLVLVAVMVLACLAPFVLIDWIVS